MAILRLENSTTHSELSDITRELAPLNIELKSSPVALRRVASFGEVAQHVRGRMQQIGCSRLQSVVFGLGHSVHSSD